MRHRKTGRRLDMNSSQRRALFRNMATSLMLHGTIRTTEARAKELRRFAERLISIGKRAPTEAQLDGEALARARADRVTAFRRLNAFLMDEEATRKVMTEYAERFRNRPGGYTRIVKLARARPGDKAPMAVIQLVEAMEPREEAVAKAKPEPVVEAAAAPAPAAPAPAAEPAAEAQDAPAE